ncbi:hypothetical protein D3C71_1103450 [compost metagenome]
MQAEGIDESLAVPALQLFLGPAAGLFRKFQNLGIDHLKDALAAASEVVEAVIEAFDMNINIGRNEAVDIAVVQSLVLQQTDLVLDQLVKIERRLQPLLGLGCPAALRRNVELRREREKFLVLPAVAPQIEQPLPELAWQRLEVKLQLGTLLPHAVQKSLGADQLDVGLELPDIAIGDAAQQRLDDLRLHTNRLVDAQRLILQQMLQNLHLLRRRPLLKRGNIDGDRNTPNERLQHGRAGVLGCRRHQQHLGAPAALGLAQLVERAGIHEVEDHLLPLRRKTMNLVQEQNAAVRLLHESLLLRIGPGERAFDMAEYMGEQQLGIVVIIRTIEHDERRAVREPPHMLAVIEHQPGEQRLADAGLAHNQRMQPPRRI